MASRRLSSSPSWSSRSRDRGDLDFIELSGALLAVAGDERDCGAFFQQYRGCSDLTRLKTKLLGDFDYVFLNHGTKSDRYACDPRGRSQGTEKTFGGPLNSSVLVCQEVGFRTRQ